MAKSDKSLLYKNIIEAGALTDFIKTIFGTAVFLPRIDANDKVSVKFSILGFICYVFWGLVFTYCSVEAYLEHQGILNNIYETRLKHYGDLFERFLSMIYVIYILYKVPLHVAKSTKHLQAMVDIDNALKSLEVYINYNKLGNWQIFTAICQLLAASLHTLSLYMTKRSLNQNLDLPLMYQVVYADAMVLLISSYYCFYLLLLKKRFKLLNRLLLEVLHSRLGKSARSLNSDDRYVTELIKACARVYAMLYEAVPIANDLYGVAMVCTMFTCVAYIILDMFYFMEVNAMELFITSTTKYVCFLVYLFWEILYSVGIVVMNVYCSEITRAQAKRTPHILHLIMNNDISDNVNTAAMHFSQQLLHQSPSFSAGGMYTLQYSVLLQGGLYVTTVLVIVLQFVTH